MTSRLALFIPALATILSPSLALAEAPAIEKIRSYLIFEDSGDVTEDITDLPEQIVANDEHGQSVQMSIDIVLRGKAGQLYENNPVLHVVTRPSLPEAAEAINQSFPIAFMAKENLYRSVIVNHNCNGFEFEAYVTDGDRRVSEFRKNFSITCGD